MLRHEDHDRQRSRWHMRHALRKLHYLTVIAQAGSFRRAAEICEVDQSNVSRAVQQLENSLGVALFERSR